MFRLFFTFALFAVASAFLSSKLSVRTQVANSRLFSVCDDYKKDAKGRCPGDTGYIPIIKEAPVDFAAYAAAQKAKKEAEKAAKAAGKK